VKLDDFEIGRILHLKSEIRNLELDVCGFTHTTLRMKPRQVSDVQF
jgi:hypothetical protein